MTPTWPTPAQIEQSARALDPEAWAILDSDSIGMMTRRKVSLEQARAALSAVNPFEWRPIETAPKDGTAILVGATYDSDVSIAFWNGRAWRGQCDGMSAIESQGDTWTEYFEISATHWMPLPPSPEGDK